MPKKTPKTAREIALLTLLDIEINSAWSDGALAKLLSQNEISSRDSALATRLVYGVLQNMALIDFYINAYSKTKVKKMDKSVRQALRIGVYQLVFMDKIPQNAAVNESVNLVKKYARPHLTSFANGILRQFTRNLEQLPRINADTKEEYLALKYSHPIELTRKLFETYGRQTTESILKANNETAPTVIRINRLQASDDLSIKELEEAGASIHKIDEFDGVYECQNIGNLLKLECFKNGEITVQDTASQLAVYALNPTRGSFMIDCCSAPGGKSFLSAQLMENEGNIISCDVHAHKIDIIEQGAQRLGAEIVQPALLDASKRFDRFVEKADFVLCDVPCSGIGIIRKKPEIRYKSLEEIANLPEIQYNILDNCKAYVKPFGALVYSTCTILPEENIQIVEKFLKNNENFQLEQFELPKLGKIDNGMITLLQGVDGTDGFFIAKFRRKS